MNRRRFLQQTSAATALLGFPAITRSASPNSFLQVGCIGVGGMGRTTMMGVSTHEKVKITSICDVDATKLGEAAKQFPEASNHTDWRQMLRDHADKFDAVTIGTPDHMHAAPAVLALRAKKHVYLQKPMAPTIHECRIIAAEAAKAGVVTQMGNQGRSSVESRMMVELLRSGAIGKVKEIILWENKALNWWPKNTDLHKTGDKVPAELNWDLWLGVRPDTPYLTGAYHPQCWRAWTDFGVGELGDMGCHHFDPTVDGLALKPPKRVRQSFTGEIGKGLWAKAREVEYEFEGDGVRADKTLKLTWYDGEHLPDQSRITLPKVVTKFPAQGGFWIGDKGSIFRTYTQRPYVLPEEDFPAEKYPRNFSKQDHYHDWVDAILTGRKSCADFAHAANLSEIVLAGTLAEKAPLNAWVTWDQAAQETNFSAINAELRRTYREGWQVEGLG